MCLRKTRIISLLVYAVLFGLAAMSLTRCALIEDSSSMVFNGIVFNRLTMKAENDSVISLDGFHYVNDSCVLFVSMSSYNSECPVVYPIFYFDDSLTSRRVMPVLLDSCDAYTPFYDYFLYLNESVLEINDEIFSVKYRGGIFSTGMGFVELQISKNKGICAFSSYSPESGVPWIN